MPKRYRKLRGDTAYYPFAARTGLRARQRRHARALRTAGAAALILAAVLALRQGVFRGGQPDAPAPLPSAAPAVTAAPGAAHVSVQPLAATRDALAETQQADTQAHTTPESAAQPPAARTAEVLPRYRSLYEQNPDLIGWLRIDGTGIDLPVVQTPGDNEYYLRRGFDRFYAVGGTLFLDERCSVEPDAPTDNWLIYGHNMRDGSMFGQLVRYRDEAFCQAHPTFTFDTLYETATLLRLGVVLAAGLAGPVGLVGAFFAVLLSLSGTCVLGVPYLEAHPFPQKPLAQDGIFRRSYRKLSQKPFNIWQKRRDRS